MDRSRGDQGQGVIGIKGWGLEVKSIQGSNRSGEGGPGVVGSCIAKTFAASLFIFSVLSLR